MLPPPAHAENCANAHAATSAGFEQVNPLHPMARGTPRSGQRSVYQKTPVCYLAATWDPENKRLFYGVLMLRLVFIRFYPL